MLVVVLVCVMIMIMIIMIIIIVVVIVIIVIISCCVCLRPPGKGRRRRRWLVAASQARRAVEREPAVARGHAMIREGPQNPGHVVLLHRLVVHLLHQGVGSAARPRQHQQSRDGFVEAVDGRQEGVPPRRGQDTHHGVFVIGARCGKYNTWCVSE